MCTFNSPALNVSFNFERTYGKRMWASACSNVFYSGGFYVQMLFIFYSEENCTFVYLNYLFFWRVRQLSSSLFEHKSGRDLIFTFVLQRALQVRVKSQSVYYYVCLMYIYVKCILQLVIGNIGWELATAVSGNYTRVWRATLPVRSHLSINNI